MKRENISQYNQVLSINKQFCEVTILEFERVLVWITGKSGDIRKTGEGNGDLWFNGELVTLGYKFEKLI